MKFNLLSILIILFFISCASNKQKENKNEKPVAELQIAPNYIHADLEILSVEDTKTPLTIRATILEVLRYGSTIEPIPSGSVVSFHTNDELYKEYANRLKSGKKIRATLRKEPSGMMMNKSNTTNMWKLISINN